jgi:tRNA(fMet)-specific endonuclease VapC
MEKLTDFCAPLTILPFDAVAAEHYGLLRAHLEAAGAWIGPMDLMIAAHALACEVTLVTSNEGEFRRVPNLHIENWLL